MAWVEWLKIFVMIVTVFGALSAPFVYIWKRSERDKQDNSESIKALTEKVQKHEVDITGLDKGKVGHHEMQAAIQRLESSTNNQIQSLQNKIDSNHNQYREELSRNMSDLKDYMKDMMGRNNK
ncbi:hypothetical protein vBVpaMR16F_90 [Vibrio phage vB_VpaM_R16F]|nr:hypothetical protein vBVpaMR16F_90 [Vibrio phage vB_VpaM_R16F]